MNSKFLHFLFVLACAALIGFGPLRAQNPATGSDANGSAVTAPSRQSDAAHKDVSPASAPSSNDARTADASSDSRNAAKTAIENDRGIVPANQASTPRIPAWIGLFGLFGLLGLARRRNVEQVRTPAADRREDYPRAA